MVGLRVALISVLAGLVLLPTQLLAFEPLSEDELDRTIASGMEPARPVDTSTRRSQINAQGASVVSTNVGSETTEENAESDASEPEEEFALVAYREALPIVMNRMTNANRGPLGRNGDYSLSPLEAVRADKLPVGPVLLRLGPLPSRAAFFGR
jgi:hypothetical protein